MSIFAWVSVVASLSASTCDLRQLETVVTTGRDVTVSDVMDPACLAPAHRDEVAGLVVARLPAGIKSFGLARSAVKSLIHRRVPGVSFQPSPSDSGVIKFVVDAPPEAAPSRPSCVRASRNIAADEVLSRTDVETVSCDALTNSRTSVAYDRRQNVLRSVRPITSGENLGRLDAPDLAFDEGDRLTLFVTLGAVRIAREVVAVQAAPAGGMIFVRDGSGAIFAAPTSAPERGGVQR